MNAHINPVDDANLLQNKVLCAVVLWQRNNVPLCMLHYSNDQVEKKKTYFTIILNVFLLIVFVPLLD